MTTRFAYFRNVRRGTAVGTVTVAYEIVPATETTPTQLAFGFSFCHEWDIIRYRNSLRLDRVDTFRKHIGRGIALSRLQGVKHPELRFSVPLPDEMPAFGILDHLFGVRGVGLEAFTPPDWRFYTFLDLPECATFDNILGSKRFTAEYIAEERRREAKLQRATQAFLGNLLQQIQLLTFQPQSPEDVN